MALAHTDLFNYYKTNFALKQHYNWDITELEDMIPFEREVYVDMLLAYLEEQRLRLQQAKGHM